MNEEKEKHLTPKQAMFVQEYLVDLNGTQAAIRAGYSEDTAKQIATENLAKPYLKKAIDEAIEARSARTKITQDRVLQEYARIAFVDPRKFYDEDGNVLSIDSLDEDTARAVGAFESSAIVTDDGTKGIATNKIKFIDKKGALDSLGKHLGMFVEKVQHAGAGGGPLVVQYMVQPVKPAEVKDADNTD